MKSAESAVVTDCVTICPIYFIQSLISFLCPLYTGCFWNRRPNVWYPFYGPKQRRNFIQTSVLERFVFAVWPFYVTECHVQQYKGDIWSSYCERSACGFCNLKVAVTVKSSWEHWYWHLKCELFACVLLSKVGRSEEAKCPRTHVCVNYSMFFSVHRQRI